MISLLCLSSSPHVLKKKHGYQHNLGAARFIQNVRDIDTQALEPISAVSEWAHWEEADLEVEFALNPGTMLEDMGIHATS